MAFLHFKESDFFQLCLNYGSLCGTGSFGYRLIAPTRCLIALRGIQYGSRIQCPLLRIGAINKKNRTALSRQSCAQALFG